jgi:hypothetical protein
VTAIVVALSAAATKDPRALSRCVEALGLALAVLAAEACHEEDGAGVG